MEQFNNHINYTAADIKRYLTGEMTTAEMHAIEKAALDDPFLAEALEGYELMEQKDWRKELATLKSQLATENAAPVVSISKTHTVKWWRIAAAVLLLLTTAITAYLFTKNNNTGSQNIAQNQKPASSREIASGNNDSGSGRTIGNHFNSTASDSVAATPQVKNESSGATTLSTSTGTYYNFSTDSSFVYTPPPVTDKKNAGDMSTRYDEVDANKQEAKEKSNEVQTYQLNTNAVAESNWNNANISPNSNSGILENRTVAAESDKYIPPGAGYRKQHNNANYTFIGQVTGTDNQPLAYATVKSEYLKKPVYTDAKGFFKLTAPDSNINITVNSAGFLSGGFDISNKNTLNTITLTPQPISAGNIGIASKDKKAVARRPVVDSADLEDDAEPAGGWVQYNNYLNNNNRLSEPGQSNRAHGEVEVTVNINAKGEIAQVKVDKPLNPECDAEAVRLVKEGPKWDIKSKKKNASIKIKVIF